MVRGVLPVSPDRTSLRMTDRAAAGGFRQSSVQSFAGRSQAASVARVPFEQQQRSMQQISRTNFNVPNRGSFGGGGAASPSGGTAGPAAAHGWGRFGEPIHSSGPSGAAPQSGSSGGWGRIDNSRPGAPSNNFSPGQRSFAAGGGGEAVHISPPMVQQRAPSAPSYQAPRYQAAPSYQAPRSAPSYQAPRSAPSYQAPRSAPSYQAPRSAPSGGGGNRGGGGGGGGRSSGGGGGHGGAHR